MRIACGVDLVSVPRVARLLESDREALLQSVWTQAERATCRGRAERLAARWAAKEATLKALQQDLFNNRIRQGIRRLPERIKFLFDPRYAFWRCVLPQKFIVLFKGAFRLVDRAQKTGFAPVDRFNDAGLAMNKDLIFRHNTDLNLATG